MQEDFCLCLPNYLSFVGKQKYSSVGIVPVKNHVLYVIHNSGIISIWFNNKVAKTSPNSNSDHLVCQIKSQDYAPDFSSMPITLWKYGRIVWKKSEGLDTCFGKMEKLLAFGICAFNFFWGIFYTLLMCFVNSHSLFCLKMREACITDGHHLVLPFKKCAWGGCQSNHAFL